VELVRGFAAALPHLPQDLLLVFAGSEPEPDYSAEVRAAVHDTRVQDRVRFLGHVPYEDLPPLYAAASLFLFPSTCESFPNILLEALATGVPVLSSNRCSMPEIAGDSALYFDPDDPADIARLIVETWADAATRDRLGRAGVERAKRFSWNATAQGLLRIMSEVA
jgi:glycosyltransferase involved in cell wall biosynthesis